MFNKAVYEKLKEFLGEQKASGSTEWRYPETDGYPSVRRSYLVSRYHAVNMLQDVEIWFWDGTGWEAGIADLDNYERLSAESFYAYAIPPEAAPLLVAEEESCREH